MGEQDRLTGIVEEALSRISARSVLDVATGGGGFIDVLVDNLGSYTKITGIDNHEQRLEAARKAHNQENIHFQCMDAAHLDFPDSYFDTVCMANSLHHMTNLPGVLSEILRVCKPGGMIIISETYRDCQSKTQLTNVLLHDWWAAVDSAEGISHHKTFKRQQIIELASKLGLKHLQYYEDKDLGSDPMDPDLIKELDGIIDRFIQRSQDLNGAQRLCLRGEELRRRVHQVGFQGATSLWIIGKK